MMLQAAARSPLPVGAGYLDALSSVLGALKGSTYRLGQPPLVRILDATVAGRGRNATTAAQVAVLGSTDAIRRYRVALDGRTVSQLRPQGSPFTIRSAAIAARKLRVDALDASGKTLRRRPAGSRRRAPASAGSGAAAASGRAARCGSNDARVWLVALARRGDRRRRAERRAGRDAHDHDERLDADGGGHGRPGVLLPASGASPTALLDRRWRHWHRHRRRRAQDRRRRPREPPAGARRPAGSRVLADRPQRCLPGHEPRESGARSQPGADTGSRRRPPRELDAGPWLDSHGRDRAGGARRARSGRGASSCPCSSTS